MLFKKIAWIRRPAMGADMAPLMFAAWQKDEAGPRKPPGTCDIV